MTRPADSVATTLPAAARDADPTRSGISVTLVQARNASDPARDHEHACFAARMKLHPDQIRCVSIFEHDLFELDLSATDAVLVGGAGQYSVLDDIPAVKDFVRFVATVATRADTTELPMFASCFGFQALVLGMGGEVIEDAEHAEVGTYWLYAKPDASNDSFFGALPPRFSAQLGHKDRAARLPAGLLDVAGSERCPYQAVRVVGRPQVATQFHPELALEDNRSRFLRYMPEYGKLFGKDAAQERLDSHRPSPEANALLDHFTRTAVAGRCATRGGAE
jgi:GMP synthase (glutamine-hydrolysing)